jgi:hypothetical protein
MACRAQAHKLGSPQSQTRAERVKSLPSISRSPAITVEAFRYATINCVHRVPVAKPYKWYEFQIFLDLGHCKRINPSMLTLYVSSQDV